MALIEIRSAGKRYGRGFAAVTALEDVSLTIEANEFVCLMGPSGSGKSTLLGILGAMTPPSSGQVVVDGFDVYSLSAERRADFRREYLGFVFQQLFLVPYLTAIENVMLPLAAAAMLNSEQRELSARALASVGLADKARRLPQELSGGEQQRVAIARAIVNQPPLLLADEPTGCLDSRTGREIMDVFHSLRARGQTIFMVTHDANVAACADRIVMLSDGRLVRASSMSRAPTAPAPATPDQGSRDASGAVIPNFCIR